VAGAIRESPYVLKDEDEKVLKIWWYFNIPFAHPKGVWIFSGLLYP